MSTYIKLSTKEYPRHIGDIEIDPAGMADYALVEWVDPPTIDPRRQRYAIAQPFESGGKWYTNWTVTQIPDSEEAAKVREDRNKRLAECDWTQLSDSPADKVAWAAYRQALRDITKQSGFPWNITWPTQP